MFPATVTPIGGINSNGNLQTFRVDTSSNVEVNCVSGCSGSSGGGSSWDPLTIVPSSAIPAGFVNSVGNIQLPEVDNSSNVLVNVKASITLPTTITNSVTTTYVTNPTTTTISGTVPISLIFPTTAYVVNPSTVTFNGVAQPVLISSQGVTASTIAAAQIGTWTVSPGTGTYPVAVLGTVPISLTFPTTVYVVNPSTVTQGTAGVSAWKIDLTTGVQLQTGTNAIGKVNFNNPTTVTLSSVTFNFNGTGNTTVIPGVSAQTIRIFEVVLMVSANTNITFEDGAGTVAGANAIGPLPMLANGSIILDFNGEPYFLCAAADNFVINQSGSASITGKIWYTQS